MSEYSLVEPFGIDSPGDLPDDVSLAFVLGVEWEMFRINLAEESSPFERNANAANRLRLGEMCRRHRRSFRVHDLAPGWIRVCVGAQITS